MLYSDEVSRLRLSYIGIPKYGSLRIGRGAKNNININHPALQETTRKLSVSGSLSLKAAPNVIYLCELRVQRRRGCISRRLHTEFKLLYLCYGDYLCVAGDTCDGVAGSRRRAGKNRAGGTRIYPSSANFTLR